MSLVLRQICSKFVDFATFSTWGNSGIRLLQSGSSVPGPAYARAMREVVARRIIDMAQRGTRDQKRAYQWCSWFPCCELSTERDAGKVLREPLSRRRRFRDYGCISETGLRYLRIAQRRKATDRKSLCQRFLDGAQRPNGWAVKDSEGNVKRPSQMNIALARKRSGGRRGATREFHLAAEG